ERRAGGPPASSVRRPATAAGERSCASTRRTLPVGSGRRRTEGAGAPPGGTALTLPSLRCAHGRGRLRWLPVPRRVGPSRSARAAGIGPGSREPGDFLHAVPPEDKAKFDRLAAVLREQLSGIKVYKVGDEA